MIVSKQFLDFALSTFNVIMIPKNHVYEYALNCRGGVIFNVLELEYDIVDDFNGNLIGKFGISLEDKIIAYYLMG